VAQIVDGCTDTDQHPKPPWRARKEAFLTRLAEASPSVRLVSACDKLDNVRAILAAHRVQGENLWAKFRGGREGTLWYFTQVVKILRAAGDSPLVDELSRAVGELEQRLGSGQKAGLPPDR
jgi:GTP pyrophosphokinase